MHVIPPEIPAEISPQPGLPVTAGTYSMLAVTHQCRQAGDSHDGPFRRIAHPVFHWKHTTRQENLRRLLSRIQADAHRLLEEI